MGLFGALAIGIASYIGYKWLTSSSSDNNSNQHGNSNNWSSNQHGNSNNWSSNQYGNSYNWSSNQYENSYNWSSDRQVIVTKPKQVCQVTVTKPKQVCQVTVTKPKQVCQVTVTKPKQVCQVTVTKPKAPEKFKPVHQLQQNLSYTARNVSEITLHLMTNNWRALLPHEDLDPTIYAKLTLYNVQLTKTVSLNIYKLHSSRFRFDDNIKLGDDIILIPSTLYGRKLTTEEIINVMKSESNGKVCFIKAINKFDLEFSYTFRRYNDLTNTYTVIFRPGRYTMRYQYRALDLLDAMSLDLKQHFLFPAVSYASYSSTLGAVKLQFTNKQVESNVEQRAAVEHIAFTKHYQAPYIVFGPPGTGKTTTLVEGITQLYKHQPASRILIMTQTNSMCDEIAVRLLRSNPAMSLYRVFSQTALHHKDTIDKLLLETERSNYALDYYPAISYIESHRVLVCTLNVGGKLALGDLGYFRKYTHIFVDEAASCMEPDILMGVASLLTPNVNLILAGDHKQLGPVLQSNAAKNTLLRVSLMERLLKRPCYHVDAQGRYNRNIQIRLRNNYRSHPAIVKLYNELYYNNELRAMAKPEKIRLSKKLGKVMNSKFPITFHASYEESQTSEDTKSSCNHAELDIVMDYVKELTVKMGLTKNDIGIISPYNDQLQLLKNRLKKNGCDEIEIGTVEKFQGKEKRCIIISFVRSKTHLGFLKSPERLNVMLSRPKSLLIMVGNPRTLCQSKDFRHVINVCNKNLKSVSGHVKSRQKK